MFHHDKTKKHIISFLINVISIFPTLISRFVVVGNKFNGSERGDNSRMSRKHCAIAAEAYSALSDLGSVTVPRSIVRAFSMNR